MTSLFKKSALVLALLSLASSSYAQGTLIGVFGGIDGLDLQPRNGDLGFLTVFPFDVGTVNTYSIHPTYAWDFRLYAGLDFCGNDDFTASWTRFHTHDSNNFGTPPLAGETIAVSNPRWLFISNFWSSISANVNFNLDDVYGVYAHSIYTGPWVLRFGAGVDWTRLYSQMTVIAHDNILNGIPRGFENDSHLIGLGPRVELDMTYHLPYGFAMFARTNAVVFVANRHTELENAGESLTEFEFENSTHYVIVPKLGIKLGVNYSYLFGSMGGEGEIGCSTTYISLEAGWQAESYIHAIERPQGFSNPFSVSERSNLTKKMSNYGNEGFFLGVKLNTSWV